MKNEYNGNSIILNKVFTGSYLIYNLGNELINFIKTDNNNSLYSNKRFIYINPYGAHNQKNSKNTKYVFHIMGINYEGKYYYELVAISEIDKEHTIYNKDADKIRTTIKDNNINFNNHSLIDIFDDENAHLCSFISKNFFTPKKGVRILFEIVKDDDECSKEIGNPKKNLNSNIYIIKIKSNPQHSMCYSKADDEPILFNLLDFFEINNDFNIVLDNKIDDEQCLAVICDRTKLEDSTSNQIAYFLSRDDKIMQAFIELINKNIKSNKIVITENTKFEILREKKHIDLLIKVINDNKNNDNNHIIVIENKIDSYINGIKYNDKNGNKLKPPYDSQLSAYYKYINSDNEFIKIPANNTHFFILVPEYSSVTNNKLKEEFVNGNDYTILSYNDLYNTMFDLEYNPYNENSNSDNYKKKQFLFNQFKDALKYIISSNAEQMKTTAYIRLKQRINELNKK